MSNKSYDSVVEMLRDTSDDQASVKLLEERIRRRQIVKKLMAIRASRGLTQADIAKRIGCLRGRIAKFEASDDDDVRLRDLRDYLRALQLDLRLLISPHERTAGVIVEEVAI